MIDFKADKLPSKCQGVGWKQSRGWLETVVCLLDKFEVPLLESSCDALSELSNLKEEKLENQVKIIDLQNK